MEHISLSAELGEIRYAIEGAHWIAGSVAMGAVPDPDRTHSAPVIISAILLLVENTLPPSPTSRGSTRHPLRSRADRLLLGSGLEYQGKGGDNDAGRNEEAGHLTTHLPGGSGPISLEGLVLHAGGMRWMSPHGPRVPPGDGLTSFPPSARRS